MTNPYRHLCAELVDAWASGKSLASSIVRARALLAQPELAGPTDEELLELMPQQMLDDLAAAARAMAGFDRANVKAASVFRIILNRHAVDHARAVLAKYGTPTPQPVLVSERLPGPEDTTSRNQCWYWHPDDACWEVVPVVTYTWDEWSHWLPANAIPIPRPPMPDLDDELERK